MKGEDSKVGVIIEKVVYLGLIVITYHWIGVLEAILWALVVFNLNLFDIRELLERKQDD